MDNEVELVEKMKQGDLESFAFVYNHCHDILLRCTINIIHNRSIAEDIIQDVFIKFIKDIRKFRLITSLKFYLIRCARNRAKDIIRSSDYKIQRGFNFGNIQSWTKTAEQIYLENEQNIFIDEIICNLPIEQKEAILLRFFENKKFREIAEEQKVSINTAFGHIHYGLENIKNNNNFQKLI